MPRVTLTTDFGTADGYAAAMKGVIFSRCPEAQVVDLTHEVPRHDVGHAAYVLATAAPWFPEGTVHVAVVDPGVGSDRRALIVDAGRHVYVGPDNGVFDLVAGARQAFEIRSPAFTAESVCATFHGRDVFAPAAAALLTGAEPEQAGPPVTVAKRPAAPDSARIVHIDRFGNIITNLRPEELGDRALRVGGHTFATLGRTYADVDVGELVAYVGSAGTIEVAVRDGDAASSLCARRGDGVELLS